MNATTTPVKMSTQELTELVLQLQERVKVLETPKSSTPGKEMTDDDARNILFGDHASTKHKDAASALGLTYGQVYSCRLGYTFKNVHKEGKEQGKTNIWMK